ncbi:hypothetical protein [Peribacillus simplex]|uniref:hypothetical protein n=1 Tax=Peribacillus simplex TaxID=1478 RepID=UPI003D27F7C9
MDVFGAIVMFLGLLALIVFLIWGVISLVRKNGKAKKRFIASGISVGAFIVGFIIVMSTVTEEEQALFDEEQQAEEQAKIEKEAAEKAEAEEAAKTPEEKAAEAKEKAEQEAKEKAEAEAQAKKDKEAAEKAEAEMKANAKTIEYAQMIKNPDRYAGEYVKYRGQIVQIQEGDDMTVIRLAVTQDSYGWDSNEVIWVEVDGYTDFVDEDVVTVYGTVVGSHSYTSQAGWEITVPAMLADTVE